MEPETPKKTPKQKASSFLKATLPYVVIVIVVALIRTFIITPVQVEGMSMYSTLDDKEILLLKNGIYHEIISPVADSVENAISNLKTYNFPITFVGNIIDTYASIILEGKLH